MATEVMSSDPSAVPSSRFATDDAANRTRTIFRAVTLVIVVVSVVSQTIALASPGWNILTIRFVLWEENAGTIMTVSESVYYTTTCVEQEGAVENCEARSRWTNDHGVIDVSAPSTVRKLGLNTNKEIHKQVDVQLAWILTLAVLMFHLYKTVKGEAFPRVTVVAAIFLGGSCVIMYAKLFDAFIELDYTGKFVGELDNTVYSVGFPYSVFFYCFGLIMCAIACCLCCKSVFDYISECSEEIRRDQERRVKEWYAKNERSNSVNERSKQEYELVPTHSEVVEKQ